MKNDFNFGAYFFTKSNRLKMITKVLANGNKIKYSKYNCMESEVKFSYGSICKPNRLAIHFVIPPNRVSVNCVWKLTNSKVKGVKIAMRTR